MIYFDNNSTTRVLDCVADVMRPFMTERYSNPSSAIARFNGVPQFIAAEKSRLCQILGADTPDQFVTTSGATESNNLAVLGTARANRQRRHIVTSSIEHPSVLETVASLKEDGYRITLLPVSTDGTVSEQELALSLCPDTLLVSIMMANNESGVLQPIASLAARVKERDPLILFHSDATQAVGKMTVDLASDLSDIDLLSFSAHKFHGPKGIGALFVRDPNTISPILYGGGQQNGIRSGTENPAGIVGMATALAKLTIDFEWTRKVRELRDWLEAGIQAAHPSSFVLGSAAKRLPTTTFVCLPGIDGDDLVDRLAAKNIAISTGSACSFGSTRPSHVALAHGLSYEHATSCVRISLSMETTDEEVELFLQAIEELVGSGSQTLEIG
jgi:cysteine desulfurase